MAHYNYDDKEFSRYKEDLRKQMYSYADGRPFVKVNFLEELQKASNTQKTLHSLGQKYWKFTTKKPSSDTYRTNTIDFGDAMLILFVLGKVDRKAMRAFFSPTTTNPPQVINQRLRNMLKGKEKKLLRELEKIETLVFYDFNEALYNFIYKKAKRIDYGFAMFLWEHL